MPTQASVALVLLLGVSNRVLNKMALVPLGNHLFALAQLQTCAYVIIYASILYSRRKCAPQLSCLGCRSPEELQTAC